jgi:hypothetical protein
MRYHFTSIGIAIIKKQKTAGCWWLKHVLPATQEAEIRRIAVPGQPGQILHKTLS